MLLQVAIDQPSDLYLVVGLAEVADIIEIGTRVIKSCGLGVLAEVRATAPGVLLLADMKTADGGKLETELAAAAGANLTTVLACAADATLEAVAQTAAARGLGVLVDTLGDDRVWRRPAVQSLAGTALLLLHTPLDNQTGTASFGASAVAARRAGFRIAVAGGVGPAHLDEIAASGAEVVIVGGAITRAANPVETARGLRTHLPDPGMGWFGT